MGVAAFVKPDWASANFPWTVGPFFAMTLGAWSLGTAAVAIDVARDPRARRTLPMLVYLVAFGIGELLILAVFLDKLQLGGVLTYPYLIGLASVTVGAAAVIDTDEDQDAGRADDSRHGPGRWERVAAALFAATVTVLAAGTLIAGANGSVAQGRFFPEALSLFSIRAFSAFFIAIAASALSVLVVRDRLAFTELARSGLYLIVPITVASLLYLKDFDFGRRPGGLLYLGAYLGVGVILGGLVLADRRHRQAG